MHAETTPSTSVLAARHYPFRMDLHMAKQNHLESREAHIYLFILPRICCRKPQAAQSGGALAPVEHSWKFQRNHGLRNRFDKVVDILLSVVGVRADPQTAAARAEDDVAVETMPG